MHKWLIDYQKLVNDIDYLDFRLEREVRELKRWTYGDLQDVKLSEHSIASGLEDRIIIYEYELAHKMNDLYDAKELISRFDGVENQILFYKYVKDMTLEKVADQLNYSSSYIYQKHAEIMKRFKFIDELALNSQ